MLQEWACAGVSDVLESSIAREVGSGRTGPEG